MATTPARDDRRPPAAGGPTPLNSRVSAQMQRMPRCNTGPETALRRALHRRGLRFRVHVTTLPGRPDIALTRARIAVFVDGCFWHRCPEHGSLPKNNREWWEAKLSANVERDRRKDAQLLDAGWLPFHVWEHESVVEVAARLETLREVRLRTPASGARGRTGRV